MSDSPKPHQADNRSSDEDIYRLLSDPRRRQIIWILAVADDWQMSIHQLASHVAAYENQKEHSELSRSDITPVRNSIKRYHIGPLSDLNVVNIDWRTVTPSHRFFGAVRVILRGQEWSFDRQTN